MYWVSGRIWGWIEPDGSTWAVHYVVGWVKEREGDVVVKPPSCCGCVGWYHREKEKIHPPLSATKWIYNCNLTMNVSGIMSHHLQVEVMAPSRGHIMLCRIWISYGSAYPNRITLNTSISSAGNLCRFHTMTTEIFCSLKRRDACTALYTQAAVRGRTIKKSAQLRRTTCLPDSQPS